MCEQGRSRGGSTHAGTLELRQTLGETGQKEGSAYTTLHTPRAPTHHTSPRTHPQVPPLRHPAALRRSHGRVVARGGGAELRLLECLKVFATRFQFVHLSTHTHCPRLRRTPSRPPPSPLHKEVPIGPGMPVLLGAWSLTYIWAGWRRGPVKKEIWGSDRF